MISIITLKFLYLLLKHDMLSGLKHETGNTLRQTLPCVQTVSPLSPQEKLSTRKNNLSFLKEQQAAKFPLC
jgi:hypothetical protein